MHVRDGINIENTVKKLCAAMKSRRRHEFFFGTRNSRQSRSNNSSKQNRRSSTTKGEIGWAAPHVTDAQASRSLTWELARQNVTQVDHASWQQADGRKAARRRPVQVPAEEAGFDQQGGHGQPSWPRADACRERSSGRVCSRWRRDQRGCVRPHLQREVTGEDLDQREMRGAMGQSSTRRREEQPAAVDGIEHELRRAKKKN